MSIAKANSDDYCQDIVLIVIVLSWWWLSLLVGRQPPLHKAIFVSSMAAVFGGMTAMVIGGLMIIGTMRKLADLGQSAIIDEMIADGITPPPAYHDQHLLHQFCQTMAANSQLATITAPDD